MSLRQIKSPRSLNGMALMRVSSIKRRAGAKRWQIERISSDPSPDRANMNSEDPPGILSALFASFHSLSDSARQITALWAGSDFLTSRIILIVWQKTCLQGHEV